MEMDKLIYWINQNGTVLIEHGSEKPPEYEAMKGYVGGYIEHVTVLVNGRMADMWVHETGRMKYDHRNLMATDIYFTATRMRGEDPEDPATKRRAAEEMARRLNVPIENIQYLGEGDGKPDGIYGNAIVCVGYNSEEY